MKNDPFDIRWIQDDPLGRDVKLRNSTVNARETISKHTGDEFLPSDEIRGIIADPQRIDLTQQSPGHMEIYYSEPQDKPHKYGRVVVRFDGNEGEAISWSRYKEHVSCIKIVYEKSGGER